LKDAEGAPVKVGQTLFEIAPLHAVKLELAVAEDDLPFVRVGRAVTARLDGYRGGTLRGTISKIHPRSEIRESQNVFVAEVELDNPDKALLPGMSGRARIAAGLRPLAWIWFHKTWHRGRTFLGV
jgi:multidrug efflux pump subunit AcrA (membrane-fusion protein)